MPLQKISLRPGVNREGTTLANKGGYYACDKVRFRSGQAEKIGGWVLDSGTVTTGSTYIGVARSLKNWIGLNGYNYLGIGTNQKMYVQQGINGLIYDITPIRFVSAAGAVTFAATNGSPTIVCSEAGHNAQTGDYVTFTSAASLGGNVTAAILNLAGGYQVTYISSTQYSITVSVNANSSDTGNGGASTVATFQITSGSATYTQNTGYGAGGYGGVNPGYASTGYGSPAPAGLGIGSQLRLWSQANYGQNLVFNPRGGALYYWAVDTNPNTYNVAQVLSPTNTNTQNGNAYWRTDGGVSACPTIANFVMVSDSSKFVIAFGTDTLGNGTQNPMLISWSDQQNITIWYPAVTNQAGNFTLSRGSQIITAIQTRQEILVLTDIALYSMQYLGAPYVWGFNLLADNISIMGPNTIASVNNVTYWMGKDKFFMYSGQVQTLSCTLREYVFQDINQTQSYQFFSGLNEGFNEIWWFYCSANSNVIDKYVVFNHLEQLWYYGNLTRTAWADTPLRGYPTSAGYAPVTTTSQAVGLTSTTIYVANKLNFPTSGVVEIEQERIIYSGSTSTSLTGCIRGAYGTVAATHSAGVTVTDIGVVQSGIVYHENGVDNGTANPPVAIDAYVQSSDFDIGDGDHFGFVKRIIPDIGFNGSTVNKPKVTISVFPRQNPGASYGTSDNLPVISAQNYTSQPAYEVEQFTEQVFCRIRGRQMALVVYSNTVGVQWQIGIPRLDYKPDGQR